MADVLVSKTPETIKLEFPKVLAEDMATMLLERIQYYGNGLAENVDVLDDFVFRVKALKQMLDDIIVQAPDTEVAF